MPQSRSVSLAEPTQPATAWKRGGGTGVIALWRMDLYHVSTGSERGYHAAKVIQRYLAACLWQIPFPAAVLHLATIAPTLGGSSSPTVIRATILRGTNRPRHAAVMEKRPLVALAIGRVGRGDEVKEKTEGTSPSRFVLLPQGARLMDIYRLPHPLVQCVASVSIPAETLPSGHDLLGQRPVAATVLTMTQRDDGHIGFVTATMVETSPQEFPLGWLVEQALTTHAPTLVDRGEVRTLALSAMQQRHFVEPRLARLVTDDARVIDVAGGLGMGGRETDLCRRLAVPCSDTDPDTVKALWRGEGADAGVSPAGHRSCERAVSRLMLWCIGEAFGSGEPGRFYEPMLALGQWLLDQPEDSTLNRWSSIGPAMRAASFETVYREDLTARLDGGPRRWPLFETGVFHS